MTLHGISKKSLKRKSNDELMVQKQDSILNHAYAKKNGSYGAMGHAAEMSCKIDNELRRRGVMPITPTTILRLVEDSHLVHSQEVKVLAV